MTSHYPMEKSHYETLGVLPSALPREIKHRYKKLALAHHPDKGGDEALFKQIKDAAECLLDSKSRAEYDEFLKAARADLFAERDPPADAEDEKIRSQSSRARKDSGTGRNHWWYHDIFSSIEEIYQESLREDFEFGARRAKPKPFSQPPGAKRRPSVRSRFRRPSRESLWFDRGLN
ncbi:uncharacterized protein PV09_07724 [Verruconis gallopava]|uniref:J domain-containing protein n=1 Tax=Verruconis gallopava TaxID=253628 RepID=A0A0D2A2X9_9PEZI|nr:uncharacterized protein PV09_07724 [Verruconis gallopava]KIW00740.1 hypothetical protein PV09_07724 [Verruconis gallopava]